QKSLPLSDPVLIIFNAGRDAQGNAKIKIYGYSKQTTVGILMQGSLRNGVLDIAVPVLSADSAVQFFTLQIPGPVLDRPDLDINIKGLDPNFAKTTCPASGKWFTKAQFQLGERSVSTGQPTSPTVTVDAPDSSENCQGIKGKARL